MFTYNCKVSGPTDRLQMILNEFQEKFKTTENKRGNICEKDYKRYLNYLKKKNVFFEQNVSISYEKFENIEITTKIIHSTCYEWMKLTNKISNKTVPSKYTPSLIRKIIKTFQSQVSKILKTPIDIVPIDYFEIGQKLLKEMYPGSFREIAIEKYCEKHGYEHWMDIPSVNFKNDDELYKALKEHYMEPKNFRNFMGVSPQNLRLKLRYDYV